MAMNAAMRKFVDDYTTYIDKERVPDAEKEIDGQFRGIGVQIRRDVARDGLLVVTPIRGSPAYKAGILAGDLITEIIREADENGKPFAAPEVTSTKGMETTDAVKLIMGLPTTKIKLKIEREGEPQADHQGAGPRHGGRRKRLRLQAEREGRLAGTTTSIRRTRSPTST